MGSEKKELKEIKELCERIIERSEDNAILLQDILERLPSVKPFTLVFTPTKGVVQKEN
jgi:hypothetical protein